MFALMDVLASREEAISLKEIGEKTGLHPSTTHRILNDLATGRFVDRSQAGSYRLGMRLLELGNLVKSRLNVRDAALVPMRELHKQIQQPVNLSVRQGDEIIYVERAYSERSGMQVVRAIGGRAPLHLTSVGKLFLADDEPQRVRAYATRTGLQGHTKNSLTQITRLGARTGQSAAVRCGTGQRRVGVGCSVHGRRHSRRPRQAGGWPVNLGASRAPGGNLAAQIAGHGQCNLRDPGLSPRGQTLSANCSARPPEAGPTARPQTGLQNDRARTCERVGLHPAPHPFGIG